MKRRVSDDSDGFHADAPTAERTLPHSLEAERAVLGVILLENDAHDRVVTLLRTEDFFRVAHQLIFGAITALLARRVGADLLTVSNHLAQHHALDDVGGAAYIASLVDGVPRRVNIEEYARIVVGKSLLRQVITAANAMVAQAYDAEASAEDILAHADRALGDIHARRATHALVPLERTAPSLMAAMEDRLAHKGTGMGLTTGFRSIDELLGGYQPGELYILASRPSIGKTSLALNTAIAGARAAHGTDHVAIVSLEMRRRALEERLLSTLSGIPFSRLRSGYLISDSEQAALGTALGAMSGALRLAIDDRSGSSIQEIRSVCRRQKAETGLALVIIDYVQLIPGSLQRRGATRTEELTDISRRCKELAEELGVPLLVLSQLTRGSARGAARPQLSDLRDCGALEQDGDTVAFLHRHHHREGGYTAFIAEKQRNGPTGTVGLTFDRDTLTFTEGGGDPPLEEGRIQTTCTGGQYEAISPR